MLNPKKGWQRVDDRCWNCPTKTGHVLVVNYHGLDHSWDAILMLNGRCVDARTRYSFEGAKRVARHLYRKALKGAK